VRVARFGAKDVARLMGDAGIVRARAKIDATISGAQRYLELEAGGESFSDFCWAFTGGKVLRGDGHSRVVSTPLSEAISKALKARGFKFVGPTIVYAWMQAVGLVEDHSADCFRRARRPRRLNSRA
jgi:DNA-3-methyladenine glycosylase I